MRFIAEEIDTARGAIIIVPTDDRRACIRVVDEDAGRCVEIALTQLELRELAEVCRSILDKQDGSVDR